MDFSRFKYISFDCYGTLIDWEAGILTALSRPFDHFRTVTRETALEAFAKSEAEVEAGPFCNYFDVLTEVLERMCCEFGLTETDPRLLANSVTQWKPFGDSRAALAQLCQEFKLVILSNVDDAMFAETQKKLETDFHAVLTSQSIGSYKPSARNFNYLLRELGCQPAEILHVAQSLFHDHVPAKAIGLTTVWVNRPSILQGQGATLPAQAKPDFTVDSMAKLVELVCP